MNLNNGSVAKWRETDPFEVPMCETGTMEVPQTLGCFVQLSSRFSDGSGGGSEAAYQLQPVGRIVFNVVHDIPVIHPLRHSDELSFPYVFLNPNKFQDVRVGQCLPENHFFIKSLE